MNKKISDINISFSNFLKTECSNIKIYIILGKKNL